MKRFFFLVFALTIALMSWEGQLNSANAVDSGPIPEQSIRLRIIANSDSFQDQWLKREIRDAIVAQMNTWVTDLHSFDEAKQLVTAKLPELQKLTDETIKQRGFRYPAQVELGEVPFPTKLYGSYVYPAGNYEALRVRIGEAKGQNWWCVLFPPLCFIDMSNGDAVEKQQQPVGKTGPVVNNVPAEENNEEYDDYQELRHELFKFHQTDEESVSIGAEAEENVNAAAGDNAAVDDYEQTATIAATQPPQVEVRSYLWDKLMAFF